MEDGTSRGKVLMGVGNKEMKDDGAGITVARELGNADVNGQWTILNCGMYPENYTRDVRRANPRAVLIVDAVDMALPPGEIRMLGKQSLDTMILTTHRIPLSSMVSHLESFVPRCMFIGIQPEAVRPGKTLTPSVREAVRRLAKFLLQSDVESLQETIRTLE